MTAYRQSLHGVNPYSAGTDEPRRFGEDQRLTTLAAIACANVILRLA